MSVYQVQCVSSIPRLSKDREYSDHTVPVSLDFCYSMEDTLGEMAQPLIVPVGTGNVPYSGSSVVSKNCSVSLYDFRVVGKNGSTAQFVVFSLYKSSYGSETKSYVFSRRLYLAANEVFDFSFDRIESLSLVPASGLSQIYLYKISTATCSFDVYCNVVVDD